MQQKMTEQELELLKQIKEDLNIAEWEYGCTMNREQLLTKLLERNTYPVRPEEAELFFNGVLPSGWKNRYFRESKNLSAFMEKLRKAISVWWCEVYLEPELRGLKGSDSLQDCQISISQMKKELNLPLRKDNMLSSHKQVESYLKKTRKQAGISPDFRFIPPKRFAEIVNIYLEAMEDRGDCTQEELGSLLSMTQGTVSKLRSEKKNITTEREYRVLLCLFVMHIKDEKQNTLICRPPEHWIINQEDIKKNRLFAAGYLALLLHSSMFFLEEPDTFLAEISSLDRFLKQSKGERSFDKRLDLLLVPKPEITKKVYYDVLNPTLLRQMIRTPNGILIYWDQYEILKDVMQMNAAHLRLLYRMPDIFFSDLLPVGMEMNGPHTELLAYIYLKQMQRLGEPGLIYLMSKMETITIEWDLLSSGSRETKKLSVYLKEFFQLMEYLSDNKSCAGTHMKNVGHHSLISCDQAIIHRNDRGTAKPLTGAQEEEYRVLFEKYIHSEWQSDRVERIKIKFSMNMQEWYFWMKMGLLWCNTRYIKDWKAIKECWQAFMEHCMEEAQRADRDEAGTVPDI